MGQQKIEINGHDVFLDNAVQIINMDGPWIGDLHIDSDIVTGGCLVDNVILEPLNDRLYFVRYHLVSKWQRDNFFTINFFDFEIKQLIESRLKFDMAYILSMDNSQLELVNAFYNKTSGIKETFELNDLFDLV